MKKVKRTRLTNLEKRQAIRNAAMPQVKKLVRKYDRAAIQACLNQLRDYEQKTKRLAEVKKEVEKLEKEII